VDFLRIAQACARGFAFRHGGEKAAYSLEIGPVLYLRK